MRYFDQYLRKAPRDVLQSFNTKILDGTALSSLVKLGRRAWAATRKRNVVGCDYCGSAINTRADNCSNCGAGAPPAPPQDEPGTIARVATVALWYVGGFIGLHCYAAGRPLRGLFYLVAFIGMFFMMVSVDSNGNLGGFGTVIMGICLTLLWAFDGVQIMRGRFK